TVRLWAVSSTSGCWRAHPRSTARASARTTRLRDSSCRSTSACDALEHGAEDAVPDRRGHPEIAAVGCVVMAHVMQAPSIEVAAVARLPVMGRVVDRDIPEIAERHPAGGGNRQRQADHAP